MKLGEFYCFSPRLLRFAFTASRCELERTFHQSIANMQHAVFDVCNTKYVSIYQPALFDSLKSWTKAWDDKFSKFSVEFLGAKLNFGLEYHIRNAIVKCVDACLVEKQDFESFIPEKFSLYLHSVTPSKFMLIGDVKYVCSYKLEPVRRWPTRKIDFTNLCPREEFAAECIIADTEGHITVPTVVEIVFQVSELYKEIFLS